MRPTNTAEEFFQKQHAWKDPLMKFREIMLATELTETIKWRIPVYTLAGKNIADAKRPETKIKRLEKIAPMIKQKIGLNDKYRN